MLGQAEKKPRIAGPSRSGVGLAAGLPPSYLYEGIVVPSNPCGHDPEREQTWEPLGWACDEKQNLEQKRISAD